MGPLPLYFANVRRGALQHKTFAKLEGPRTLQRCDRVSASDGSLAALSVRILI